MKRHRLIILLLVAFITCSKLIAQSYSIKRLGVEQGLSNNYVVSIAQDKEGFLWFATEEGLNKFDGTRFINYYKNNHSITGNELNRVYADPSKPIIWIATQRDGLNAYNYKNQTFTTYQHSPQDPRSLITNDITDIAASVHNNNGLWISTYYKGVDYLDIRSGKFIHYNRETVPSLPSNQTWTVMDGGDGYLYIGHVDNGLSILSIEEKKVKHFVNNPNDPKSLPGNDIRCIFKDTNGNIWVGTNHGLALFNTQTNSFTTFKDNQSDVHGVLSSRIFSIKQFKNNKLWITTEFNGIAILDLKQSFFLLPEQIHFEYIKEGDGENSLSNSSIRSVFQDAYNNIWIGTWGGGINFISNEPPLFNTWSYSPMRTENSLNNKVVSSICTDRDNRLWIGTDGGGINVFSAGKRVAIHNKETGELKDNSVLAAFKDSENNLWFGTFQGSISYYNNKLARFQDIYPGDNPHLDIRVFYEDKQHNIWIGSSDGIFVFSLAEKKFTHHYNTTNSKLPENLIRSIAQDGEGRFWVGTFGGGMGVYTPNFKQIKSFGQHMGFCSNTINHILCDSKKRMWIATGEGLVCFPSPKTFKHVTYQRKEGLPNTHIRAISEDRNGNIWVSTNNGISCYVTEKDCFYNYKKSDEVPSGNFMSGSVAKDKNGFIYFGSINGLCRFNPDRAIKGIEAPPVVITEMKIFGRLSNQENNETIIPLSDERGVELKHVQNSFSITFNIQNYSLAKQVEYAYMLKGLEDSWYTVNDNNSVTFRNIPPGSYSFLVKTRIHNQNWSEKVTVLPIRINPPLWLTWWAKLLYFLAATGTLFLIFYAYKKKIDIEILYQLEKQNHVQEQELNNERLRFYTNITHELRTPLTLILGPLEDIQKDTSLSPKQIRKISVIHQSALRLLNLINQILEFRKTETQNKKLCISKGDIAALVYEIGLKYKELNQKPDLKISIRTEADNIPLFFDKEIVTIVLDNLISNAIKYTEKGEIVLSLHQTIHQEISYTEITISDTGYGIASEALPHIFDRYYQESGRHQASGTGIGLALVRNLVTLHQGEIRVESTLNKGTTFFFGLLTNNTYPTATHAEIQEKEITTEQTDLSHEEMSDSNKPVLLVVEDNQDILNYISDAFSESFEIVTATNGEEGRMKAFNNIPDIIVSDIMMPVMDGISLCKLLKEDIRTSHIPIILLTAKDALQDKEEGYAVGADSYLTKPFSATLLRSRINNLLESRKKLVEQFIAKHTLTNKRATIAESMSKLDNEFINKVTQMIEDNLSSEKTDITYLSDKMCMSSSTLYRKMKALTGLSTNEFIRKIRMQHAEKLLLEGKYSISEISFKVGINSTVYFRQCFKEEFGSAPSDYLKQITPSKDN